MDDRAAKLAKARKKLKDHQDKKSLPVPFNTSEAPTSIASSDATPYKENPESIVDSEPNNAGALQENQIYQTAAMDSYEGYESRNSMSIEPRVNVTEILISTKQNLESQIYELQSKISQLEHNLREANNSIIEQKQQNNFLENELKNLRTKCIESSDQIASKDKIINEYNIMRASLTDENNNLQEQLEFTKNIVSTKDMEISSLSNQLFYMQNQLEATHLQLQQLTGSQTSMVQNVHSGQQHNTEELTKKISTLEQQLKTSQKERDQINSHYEHYVKELNEQLQSVLVKNQELNNEIQHLSNRENSLIEQLSDMEIRLQNYRAHQVTQAPANETDDRNKELDELQLQCKMIQEKFNNLNYEHEELSKKYEEANLRLKKITEEKEANQDESRNITKLNADITSDKIAAQRATEQNKKLKKDLQELEEAFVKLSQDKLELTEKVAAEKFLNRELTIKLAEIEEKANDIRVTLKAKDEEMMRLQTTCRDIEAKYEKLIKAEIKTEIESNENGEVSVSHNENCHEHDMDNVGKSTNELKHECLSHATLERDDHKIPKEDAMVKLQERFLKIMGDVADLSDEKHRLEHIILQLQNETDTICEYVALYQQQRSLLKKRDEERSAQIKIFQSECELLKRQLEELSSIIVKFTTDKDLASYFADKDKYNEVRKVMELLSKLKSNTLIDPMRESSELKNFYPCSCCSGQLIEI